MLGRLKEVPNLDLRHRAEDEDYFFTRVQFPHGGPFGRSGEEPWLLTDGDLQDGFEQAETLRPSAGWEIPEGWLILPDVGNVWFATDVAGVHYNVVRLAGPAAELAFAFTDDRLERIRKRVERNAEDIEANAPRWLEDLLD